MQPEAYEIMAETEDQHWWFVGRRRIISSVLAGLRLPPSATLLEIGAGTGGNLAMLGQFGSLNAVELDTFARRKAIEKTGFPVQEGYLPDGLPYAPESFDLICLFDVLEHIEDDNRALTSLGSLLKPAGRILLTVPAYPWMWSRHDVKLHHFRRYTRKTLVARCKAASFEIERISYFNAFLFPLAVAMRLAEKVHAKTGNSGEDIPTAPINALFRLIFSWERAILKYLDIPFGLSLLAVLRLSAR